MWKVISGEKNYIMFHLAPQRTRTKWHENEVKTKSDRQLISLKTGQAGTQCATSTEFVQNNLSTRTPIMRRKRVTRLDASVSANASVLANDKIII